MSSYSSSLSLTFVTPEKEILKDEPVQEILCPSNKGELNILPEHAPLIAMLKPGTLSFKKNNEWQRMVVSWGYLEVHPHGVRVLAESAETGAEVSKAQAEKSLQDLNEKLKSNLLTPEEIRQIQLEVEKEQARIELCEKI